MNVLEKTLEEIEELKRNQDSKNQDFVTGYISALSTVEGVIAGLDEAKDINVPSNVGWISVEDGLPEDERMVLVTYMTKSGIPSVDRARFDGKYWRGSGFMGRVIAWRPIPEPYKPKKLQTEEKPVQ